MSDPVPFTDGPWSIGPLNPFCVDAPNGEVICETEHEANARLIAQAPRMYRLLMQMKNDVLLGEAREIGEIEREVRGD